MKETLIELLKLSTENEVVEFKGSQNQYNKDNLWQCFFCLKQWGQSLKDSHLLGSFLECITISLVVGTMINDSQLNDYKNEIAQHTSPPPSFLWRDRWIELRWQNVILCKNTCGMAKVKSVSWKGHYYGRDGRKPWALHDNERDRIKIQNTALDWSAQIIAEATITDLSKEAIDFAAKVLYRKNKKIEAEIQELGWCFFKQSKSYHKSKITRAAILFVEQAESDHFINPAQAKITWILKDKDNIEKTMNTFGCPFILNP